MKDLSYLQAFSPKILRETRRVIAKGFTAEDIDEFLEKPIEFKPSRRIPKAIRKQIISKTKFGKKKP